MEENQPAPQISGGDPHESHRCGKESMAADCVRPQRAGNPVIRSCLRNELGLQETEAEEETVDLLLTLSELRYPAKPGSSSVKWARARVATARLQSEYAF